MTKISIIHNDNLHSHQFSKTDDPKIAIDDVLTYVAKTLGKEYGFDVDVKDAPTTKTDPETKKITEELLSSFFNIKTFRSNLLNPHYRKSVMVYSEATPSIKKDLSYSREEFIVYLCIDQQVALHCMNELKKLGICWKSIPMGENTNV